MLCTFPLESFWCGYCCSIHCVQHMWGVWAEFANSPAQAKTQGYITCGKHQTVWWGHQTLMKITPPILPCYLYMYVGISWRFFRLSNISSSNINHQIKNNLCLRCCSEQAESCWGSWRWLEVLMSVRKKKVSCLLWFVLNCI